MKSMAVHHESEGSGLLGIIMWIGGVFCMAISNAQTSEVRTWVTFTLGAFASIISIIINYPKFRDQIKSWRANRKNKTKKNGKN